MKQLGLAVNLPLALLAFAFSISAGGCVASGSDRGKQPEIMPFRIAERAVAGTRPMLIAHRGGVVTPATPECSLAAIRLAAQRRYDMVELDVRATRDGVPVVFHDRTLDEACSEPGRIADRTLEQIRTLRFTGTAERVPTLDEALRMCRELELGVMLDIKTQRQNESYLQKIDRLIRDHSLQGGAMTINREAAMREHLKSVIHRVSNEQIRAIDQGEDVALYGLFWFGLPKDLPDEKVRLLKERGALVVPAINTFRYPREGHEELARKDVARLSAAGVDGFQIDSVYEEAFAPE